MAVDPLSSATRAAKKNLLAASLVAITFKSFDVSIDAIPVAGLVLRFDSGLFSFLLIVVIAYTLITFSLYYYIDMRNIEKTKHQVSSENKYRSSIRFFQEAYEGKIRSAVRSKISDELYATINVFSDGGGGMKDYTPSEGDWTITIQERKSGGQHLNPPDNEALYKTVNEVIIKHLESYRWRIFLHKILILPKLLAVRAAYFFRNYLTDGILPILSGTIALLGLFNMINLGWLQSIVPTS